jgi:hypothetical protein
VGDGPHPLAPFLFQWHLLTSNDGGAGGLAEARPDDDGHAVGFAQLGRAGVQHLGAGSGQLQDLLVRDDVQLARRRYEPGVGGEDPVDVLEDLAAVGLQGHRQSDGRGVRSAPAEDGDVVVLRPPLEAGDDGDAPSLQHPPDALRIDLQDLRPGVEAVRHDPRLEAGEGHRLVPLVVQGHGGQGGGHDLAGGPEQGHLPVGRLVRHLLRQVDQVVRGVPHGGDDGDHLRAGVVHAGDAPGDALDQLGVGHRAPPVLLDDQPGHSPQ